MHPREVWRLVGEEVQLYLPEVRRDATPDEFLETDEGHHTIISFNNVLVGCKSFASLDDRDRWVERHPMGKRVELTNEEGLRKAGNIIEVRVGDPPDERIAAIMIYIERIIAPENVVDWVI